MGSFIHISLAFLIPLSLIAAYPGHNLHHDANQFHQPRQDGGAPFAGIEMLSTLNGMNPPTATRTSRMTAQSAVSRPTGHTTYIAVDSSSVGPIPVSIIPQPIATICSSGTYLSSIASNISPVSRPTVVGPDSDPKLPAVATALLRLNSTEADETSAPVPTFTSYDGLGCTTLYTRKSSAICSTFLSGLGSFPIPVTDCAQSVTFSTSSSYGPLPTAVISNDPRGQVEPMEERLAHFIAPWYAVVGGRVPKRVLVRYCVPGLSEQGCGTATESWSVIYQTSSVGVTRSLTFEGVIAGVSSICIAL